MGSDLASHFGIASSDEGVALEIRGYIAASLDGYIADRGGGVDWLKPYEAVEAGYETFIATIETVVLGRTTYDQIPSFGHGWPYQTKCSIVVTSRPLPDSYTGVWAWHEGVDALARHLRSASGGDAWVVGGAKLLTAFIGAGELVRLDLFVVPVLLGDGVPLFPKQTRQRSLTLRSADRLEKGMVRLVYQMC